MQVNSGRSVICVRGAYDRELEAEVRDTRELGDIKVAKELGGREWWRITFWGYFPGLQ